MRVVKLTEGQEDAFSADVEGDRVTLDKWLDQEGLSPAQTPSEGRLARGGGRTVQLMPSHEGGKVRVDSRRS